MTDTRRRLRVRIGIAHGVLAPNASLQAAVTALAPVAVIAPPPIAPARGPPLWEATATAEQARNDSQWDSSAQPEPDIEFDQRIAW